jgi:hypothetical protein
MVKVHRGVDHLNSSDREFVYIVLRRLSDAESKGKKKGRKGSSYTVVELLETYGKHLRANEPTLNFDYISFVDVCAYEIRKLGILYHPRSVEPFELPPWDFVDGCRCCPKIQKSKPRRAPSSFAVDKVRPHSH